MASLLDIAPTTEMVVVRGTQLEVYGLSAKGIASLLARFPELRGLMTGTEFSIEELISLGGEVVAAIISAGCGSPDHKEAEAIAGRLPLEIQADLLAAILRQTLPNGVGPFVEKLGDLGLVPTASSSDSPSSSEQPNLNSAGGETGSRPTLLSPSNI
ncbi:MAG: hypothetical protein V3V97_17970 [Hyphomicrobiaceae bacterium]